MGIPRPKECNVPSRGHYVLNIEKESVHKLGSENYLIFEYYDLAIIWVI
jgi:hypothetical protein